MEISSWLEQVQEQRASIYAKRLAANDTAATGSHQVGPYISKPAVFSLFPEMADDTAINPDAEFAATVDSHGLPERTVRLVWYNQKTRNECRITRWGGNSSPVLDPESTGALAIFAFLGSAPGGVEHCRVWVCTSPEEEDIAELTLGLVLPGDWVFSPAGRPGVPRPTSPHDCWLTPDRIPPEWMRTFPTTVELHQKALELHPATIRNPDRRLLERRDCEYQLFRSVEEAQVLPLIRQGFSSIDDFVSTAGSVMQRRKSRSGISLELHLDAIFREQGLDAFERGQTTENNKKPDFIFPSIAAYRDSDTPDSQLAMLAVKTTCKDRWRQVLDEADRVPHKHLFTLQEGVSENQFNQMAAGGLTLVVPQPLHRKYPRQVRAHLLSLDEFINEAFTRAGS